MRSDRPRLLVLLAHPDDEFACSVLLRDRTSDHEVHCAYLTDGGYGGQAVARRCAESERALMALGLPTGRIHFLGQAHGFEDGRLHARLQDATDAVLELLARIGAAGALYVPAWEGGHQDHDATHLIGVTLASKLGGVEVRQFPLYHGCGLPGPWFKVLSPLAANGTVETRLCSLRERFESVRLCLSYVSQWKTWLGLLPFFALRMLASGAFPLQPTSLTRLWEAPHPGRLLYERRGFLTQQEFRSAADDYLARMLSRDDTVDRQLR